MTMLASVYDTSTHIAGTVLESVRMTPEDYPEEIRQIRIEVPGTFKFNVGQSVGVNVPGPHDFGNPDHFRLYSIANSQKGEGGEPATVTICVKRCFYIDEVSGERYPGIASNYLCDLKAGAKLSLSGPFGGAFSLPDNPEANILMVGMSTGIAPFRAFIRQMYDAGIEWKGQVRLFYGAKTGVELIYMNELQDDLGQYYDQETFKAFSAVSPRPALDAPIDLQRTIKDNAEEIWALMAEPETYVYLAGLENASTMFDNAMIAIIGSQEKWERRKAELDAGGRWAELLY